MAGTPRSWSPKETFNLIRLWKAFPCLWMKNSKDYRNKVKKDAAMRKISESLDIPVPEIVRKTHNLRCGMNTELRKARAKARQGLVHQSPWAFYRALMFIADEIPVPHVVQDTYNEEQHVDSGSGNSEDKSTDWPQIVARYGAADQEGVFPQALDLNGGFFESLADGQTMQYFAQADYDNGPMGAVDGDDLIEEENGHVEATGEIRSNPSQSAASDEDSVQEIPEPAVSITLKPASTLTNKRCLSLNETEDVTIDPPQQKRHSPDSIPFAEEYDVLGDFVSSELKQMRSTELRKQLKSMVQRVITDTSREDDMEHSLATTGQPIVHAMERTQFKNSALESDEDQKPFGQFVAIRMKEIRSEERRRRLKRTIQRFMLDMSEEDDMEYSVADPEGQGYDN